MLDATQNSAQTRRNPVPAELDALVIGTGVAGLYQLHQLREMGLKVHACDTASNVGGTWYWNRYPGAKFDSEAYIYQYLFDEKLYKDWTWSERFPGQREIVRSGGFTVAWMSPDELLIVCDHGAADNVVTSLSKTLAGEHYLAVNVSDARAVFDVSGGHARDVLAKLMPVDFAPKAFGTGMIRRSRLAQVPAAVWVTGEDAFRVVCFRSVARYVFDVLSAAAAEGSEVGLHVLS